MSKLPRKSYYQKALTDAFFTIREGASLGVLAGFQKEEMAVVKAWDNVDLVPEGKQVEPVACTIAVVTSSIEWTAEHNLWQTAQHFS